ncbi:MAG: TonB-dependent receptor plug domain-containing protein [Eudoraea sp.]|nr:TonB-dependent receptor plug domain-containing protein [Eudoraea sp.]
MRPIFIGILTVLSVIAPGYSQSKMDTTLIQQLDEVVVSDSRFELTRENSGKTVITIGAEVLERNQGVPIAALLNQFGGIEIGGSRSRQGEILGVFSRGGRGRQVLVLLDGVRVSDPSSFSQEYDLRSLAISNIESIEIIKGAASTLYGTNAATAVINVKTKKSADKSIAATFRAQMGTNQTASDQNYRLANFSNSAQISGTLEAFTYSMAVTNDYANGISSLSTTTMVEDPFSRTQTEVRLGYHPSETFSLTVYGQERRLRNNYDETFGFVDAPNQFVSLQKRAGVSGNLNYPRGNVNLNAAFTEYDSENFSAFPSTFRGDNFIMDVFNRYTIGNKLFTVLGVNYSRDRTIFANTAQTTQLDPYFNLVFVSGKNWNINSGARINVHSEYGSHWVYNLNPSYSWKLNNGHLKGLFSYSTAFIVPSLTQLFGEFGANPELEPETNRSLELGMERVWEDKMRVSLVYFDRREENAVIFNNSSFRYFNADSNINVSGVELEWHWQPSEQLEVNANYTFTERKGDNAIRIPKHKVNLSLGYLFNPKTFASLTYGYTGKRLDTDFNTLTDLRLEPFSLLGVYLSHALIPNRLKIYVLGENVGNADFVEVAGFNTRGRNLSFGFQLSF